MQRKFTYCLLAITSLTCSFIALCDEIIFNSEDDLSNWTMHYYLKPEPDRVAAALEYYSNSSYYSEKLTTRDPMAVFFAALFKNDINLIEKTYEKINIGSSDNSKIIFLNAAWFADTAKSRELIDKAKQQWNSKDVQEVIKEMERDIPPDILKGPIKSAAHLDLLWWTFFATGDSEAIKRIISVIHLQEDGHGEEILIGGAAVWSLTCNASTQQKVYDICKQELKNSKSQTKKLLEEILIKAETAKIDKL